MTITLSSRWLHFRNHRLCSCLPKQTRSLGRSSSSRVAPAFSFYNQLRLSSTSTRPEARKPWVEHLPPQIRPYLYLTRIDKPIGTLLLFYPCGQLFSTIFCWASVKWILIQHGPSPWHRMRCNRR